MRRSVRNHAAKRGRNSFMYFPAQSKANLTFKYRAPKIFGLCIFQNFKWLAEFSIIQTFPVHGFSIALSLDKLGALSRTIYLPSEISTTSFKLLSNWLEILFFAINQLRVFTFYAGEIRDVYFIQLQQLDQLCLTTSLRSSWTIKTTRSIANKII